MVFRLQLFTLYLYVTINYKVFSIKLLIIDEYEVGLIIPIIK